MERDDDDYLDAQLAEMNVELQRMTLDALDNCHKAGGRFDDLYFLAAQLGVGEAFRKHNEHRRRQHG